MFAVLFFTFTLLAAAQGQNISNNVIITLNQNEVQVVEHIVDSVIQANNYIIKFVEVIVKLLKSITQIVNNIQNNNETFINFTEISSVIQNMLNTTNDQCINKEESSVETLVISTTKDIENCYSNISQNVNQIIPDIEVLLETVVGTINNVTQGVHKCFQDNTFILGLPACLLIQYEDAFNDYTSIRQQFNTTVTTGRTIVNSFVADTKSCVRETAIDFIADLTKTIANFIECVLSN